MTTALTRTNKNPLAFRTIPIMIVALFLSLFALSPSQAAATQADADYSQAMIELTGKLQTATTSFSKIATKPPTWAMGKPYNTWKTKAIKSSNDFLAAIAALSAVEGTDGFTTSHPLLTKALANFKTGVTLAKTAMSKNDAKTMAKANASILKGNSSYAAWLTAYEADVAALNG